MGGCSFRRLWELLDRIDCEGMGPRQALAKCTTNIKACSLGGLPGPEGGQHCWCDTNSGQSTFNGLMVRVGQGKSSFLRILETLGGFGERGRQKLPDGVCAHLARGGEGGEQSAGELQVALKGAFVTYHRGRVGET